MQPLLTQARVLSVGLLIASLLFSPILASAAERGSNAGQIMFWLLGLRMAQEPRKLDLNLATVDELRAVPGIPQGHVLRIIAQRPYARLSELVRAGLSPDLIKRLVPFLTVDDHGASASLSSSIGPDGR